MTRNDIKKKPVLKTMLGSMVLQNRLLLLCLYPI